MDEKSKEVKKVKRMRERERGESAKERKERRKEEDREKKREKKERKERRKEEEREKKKREKTPTFSLPYQTGDPEEPEEESNVVSMSSEGRTPAVSDSARKSETTPSIAENTYPSLFPMINTGSPTCRDSAVPNSTAVRLYVVSLGSTFNTAKSCATS